MYINILFLLHVSKRLVVLKGGIENYAQEIWSVYTEN